MHTEFLHRLNQAKELASHIKTSQLTRYETHILYTRIWLPQIEYCLPITTFTQHQCKSIHRRILVEILPKLGYNRNYPRALVHGPVRLGGLVLTTLYAKQGIAHIRSALYYLRKQNNISDLLLISARYLQLECGLISNTFDGPFPSYDYVSNSWCASLWRYLSHINASIHLPNCFNIPPQRVNDRHIMDDMCLEFQGARLRHINQCRLWLKVITYSDIITLSGDRIHTWAWKGLSSARSNLTWPQQGKPNANAWCLWRLSLRTTQQITNHRIKPPLGHWLPESRHIQYNYLKSPDRKLIHNAIINQFYKQVLSTRLYKRISQHPTTDCRKWYPLEPKIEGSRYLWTPPHQPWTPYHPEQSNSLQQRINNLPPPLKSIIQTSQLPYDNGLQLLQMYTEGTLLGGCDGSVKSGIAGYRYKLTATDPVNSFYGAQRCPESIAKLSSLRDKRLGALALALSLHIILPHNNRSGSYKMVIGNSRK